MDLKQLEARVMLAEINAIKNGGDSAAKLARELLTILKLREQPNMVYDTPTIEETYDRFPIISPGRF